MAGDPEKRLGACPALWRGAWVCVLFALVAVVVRGVRWDETWEHAQILSGQVTYPAGHPLALYVHNAFSLQTHLSAWLLGLGAGPALVCGFRNVLFLLASMLPVYALTATLTRSVWVAWLVALLMMQGILLEFDGSYPTMVWPETYSNGHIGGGVVLLALAALIAGRHALAFFMIGLIPAIHVGQWPPLAASCGLFGLFALWQEESGKPAARWVGFFALGLAGTLLFWLLHRQLTLPLTETGPFAVGGDTEAVWKGYTALHDPHRRFPPGNGHVILLGTILLGWIGAFWGSGARLRQACVGLSLYASLIGVFVWGTMLVHAWMGPDIPFPLIAWMPYRLINHTPAIVLALSVSLILARWPGRGLFIVAGAALFGMLQPLWPMVVGEAIHARYLAGGEFVAFGLFGAALFAAAPNRGAGLWACIALTVAAIVPLAMFHRFGAVCVVAGVAAGYFVNRVFLSHGSNAHFLVPVMILVAGAFGLLWHQYQYRKHLPVPDFNAQVSRQLAGEERVLLLAPPDNMLLQATTNLPVIADVATPSLISYLPDIGPAIDRMYTEIYSGGFQIPTTDAAAPPSWEALWQSRTHSDWGVLAGTYGFSHVIAPAAWRVDLPRILAAGDYALYAVSR